MKRLLFLAGMMNACWWSSCEPMPETWEPPDAGSEFCRPFEAGCCRRPTDCGEDISKWICAMSNACIPVCHVSAECGSGEVCEDALCRLAPCGRDDECGNGEQCLGGTCEAAPLPAVVDSCQVLPEVALVKTGSTRTFTILARDARGKAIAHRGAVTWSVDEGDRGAVADGVLTGGVEAGTLKLQARVGSKDCTAAVVQNFGERGVGKVRVIVADAATQRPVPAMIVFNGQPAVEAADGVIELDELEAPFNVHAYPADDGGAKHAWVSAYGTTSKDILLYTRKSLAPARFTGTMTARSFDNLSDIMGSVHLALHGSSIAGNLFDVDLAHVLGDLVETEIDPGKDKLDALLPEGMVLGLGETMFRGAADEPFSIVSQPGVRTLWALGGNAELSRIADAFGPALSLGEFDPGYILARLQPLLGRLQSGVLTGVVAEAGKTTSINGDDGLSTLKLDTLMRLRVVASLPDLPTYEALDPDGGTAITRHFDAAIVLGGAQYDSQGFVPLGLSAAVDVLPEGRPDGRVDPVGIGSPDEGKVALRVAPLHSGMETSRHVFVALATSLNNLLGDDPNRVLSGLVTSPTALSFSGGEPTEISLGASFLGVPDLPGITNRTLSVGSKVDGASFQRLSVRDAEGSEWLVYFAPDADLQLTLPTPPTGLTDRLITSNEEQPRAVLHSVRLNDPALTYDKVLEFGSDNLDDLSSRLEAFSHIEIVR